MASLAFTQTVNVSILTMGQPQGLGIEGSCCVSSASSALMHDIGKVRTPLDASGSAAGTVVAPVDPADFGIDPLGYL